MEDDIENITRVALGRSAKLGALYDFTKDDFTVRSTTNVST